MTDVDDLVPLRDAARTLGRATTTVRGWVRDGTIRGAVKRKPSDPVWIPRSEVDRLLRELEERRTAGRQTPADWQPITERAKLTGRPVGEAAHAGSAWTPEDDAHVAAHGAAPVADVARHLGRTVGAVQHRGRVLRRRGEDG